MKKVIIILLLVGFTIPVVSKAQVNLLLRSNEDSERVEISLMPEKSYDFPKEITGSIQVTIKVPKSEDFKPGKIYSDIQGVEWMENNVLLTEGDYNYYTYGVEPLGGTVKLVKNQEVKLFTLMTNGDRKPKVLLLDSKDSVIDYSFDKLSLDIANNISIATNMGITNAYKGNLYPDLKTSEADEGKNRINVVYPNPGKEYIYVEYAYYTPSGGSAEPLKLNLIENGTGRILHHEILDKKVGRHTQRLEVSSLSDGKYLLVLQEGDQVLCEGYQFVKGL